MCNPCNIESTKKADHILEMPGPGVFCARFFIQLKLSLEEDPTKLVMQYRTRRRGFHYYVQGQVKECLKMSE